MTLGRIEIKGTSILPNGMMVFTFDDTKTVTFEEIDLKVMIGHCESEVPFDLQYPSSFLLPPRPNLDSHYKCYPFQPSPEGNFIFKNN